jgi:hypothetical protein
MLWARLWAVVHEPIILLNRSCCWYNCYVVKSKNSRASLCRVFIPLFILLGSFLGLSISTRVYADIPDVKEVPFPEFIEIEDAEGNITTDGIEANGSVCPSLMDGHITLCGRISAANYITKPAGVMPDASYASHPLTAVTVAIYLGGDMFGVRDVNNTGEYQGKVTGLYSYNVTNADGEFALAVPQFFGTGGYAFMALLCGDQLADLYMIDTSESSMRMELSIAKPDNDFVCAPHTVKNGEGDEIPAPPFINYVDRANPMGCPGDGQTYKGGVPGAEPTFPIYGGLELYDAELDTFYHDKFTDYSAGPPYGNVADADGDGLPEWRWDSSEGVWKTINQAYYEEAIPESGFVLSHKDLDGFTANWLNYSHFSASSLNCGLGGCYDAGAPSSSGFDLPKCNSVRQCNDLNYGLGKHVWPLPPGCTSPGTGLASPEQWQEYVNQIITLRPDDWYNIALCEDPPPCCDDPFWCPNNTCVTCTGKNNTCTLGDFVEDKYTVTSDLRFEYRIEKKSEDMFPTSALLNLYANRFLAATYQNKPTNDSYRNYTTAEVGSFTGGGALMPDGCSRHSDPAGEFRREYPVAFLDPGAAIELIRKTGDPSPVGDLPFKTCLKSKFSQEETYNPQRSNMLATGNIVWGADEEYDPAIAAFAAPGEILGQTIDLEVNPAVDYDRIGGGYWRLGTERPLCTVDEHALEAANFSNRITPNNGYRHPSGYKYRTEDSVDNELVFSPEDAPSDSITRAEMSGLDSGLYASFPTNRTNYPGNETNGHNEERFCLKDTFGKGNEPGESCITNGDCCSSLICVPDDLAFPLINLHCKDDPDDADGLTWVTERWFYDYMDRDPATTAGDVSRFLSSNLSMENAPAGDSTYGAWLATSITAPPFYDCSEDGACFVGNTYVMDFIAEDDISETVDHGYGLKVVGHGAPGEVYHFDRLRKSLTMNFLTNTNEAQGDLNSSYVIELDESAADVNLACRARAVGELIATVMGDSRVVDLPHILFYSATFNLTRPFDDVTTMITTAASAAGPGWAALDGVSGTVYNLHTQTPVVPMSDTLSAAQSLPPFGSKKIFLPETGFVEPTFFDGDPKIPDLPRPPAVKLLGEELYSLSREFDLLGMTLFSAYDLSAMGGPVTNSDFLGHILNEDEFRTVFDYCSGMCKDKLGVNPGLKYHAVPNPGLYSRVATDGMRFAVIIADRVPDSIADHAYRAWKNGVVLALRMGVGNYDSGGYVRDEEAGLEGIPRYEHVADNLFMVLEAIEARLSGVPACVSSSGENCVVIMVGPNEPAHEGGWLAPACGGV